MDTHSIPPFSRTVTPDLSATAAQSTAALSFVIESLAPGSSALPSVISYFVMLISEIASSTVIVSPLNVTLPVDVISPVLATLPSLIVKPNSETTLYPSGATVSFNL